MADQAGAHMSHQHARGLKPVTVAAPGSGKRLTVDLHCHYQVAAAEQLVAGTPGKRAEVEAMRAQQGPQSWDYNAKVQGPAIARKLKDVAVRLTDMDAMGVDIQAVSPSPGHFCYWADPDMARANVRLINEGIAEVVAGHPDRFVGLGNVALQHPALAAEQLEHAVKTLGFRGVEICTSVAGADLDDPKFAPFWAKVEELGAVVFLHPQSCPPLSDRLDQFYLSNIIGNPLDTTLALSHLIFGGVLDRYPGLKIVAAHGGGFLPTYAARSDHAWEARTDAHSTACAPSRYLRQLYFDTIVYTPESVRALIDAAGASQVVVGTDYPFDMGNYGVQTMLDAISGLSDAELAAIAGGNAARILGLTVTS